MLEVPKIETQRLILDLPRESDFEGYASITTTERGRWIGGPFSLKEAWLDFSQMIAGWMLRGDGALSIRPKGSDVYWGTVLVHHEFGDPEPELGYLLTAKAEGKGYAFEAAQAMRDWAFAHTALHTLVSYVHPDNQRAITLARKLGGKLDSQHHEYVAYRYTREGISNEPSD